MVDATRARGRRPRFDEAELVTAAIAVIDREGLDATTLRAVADELGVTSMALYRLVDSKDALLAAVTDRLAGAVGAAVGDAATGVEALRLIATELGAVLDRHPQAAPLFERPQLGPEMAAAAGACIDLLVADGLGRERAGGLLRATVALVIGLRVTGGAAAEATIGPIADDAVEIWLTGVRSAIDGRTLPG